MLFSVVDSLSSVRNYPSSQFFLLKDGWNDWWEYKTMYRLSYIDQDGNIISLGSVKIGEYGMVKDQMRPNLPDHFENLSDQFFSLGQDVSYYESLNELGDDNRYRVLKALNDMALLPHVYEKARNERVTTHSLLRDVRHTSVIGQYRKLAHGDAQLTPYKFKYIGPNISGTNRIVLDFEVKPETNPPSNMHILIGRNAVGKTHMINNMINSLILNKPDVNKTGYFSSSSEDIAVNELFANVVSVSFSAFDPAEPLPERKNKTKGIPYSYIGLKQNKKPPKSPEGLKYDFARSLHAIKSSNKTTRWLRAVEMLTADPIFNDADIPSILEEETENEFFTLDDQDDQDSFKDEGDLLKLRAQKFFHRLSSGHKIVLLTLTRLVQTVEERTLVLLDEPEAHLHPPLLSAFTRALSDLLIQRNAVAIIATHSPVILQEVPRSCVWKLRRNGIQLSCKRTEIETFGENIGSLTNEIFELEVTYSGFYKMLRDAVKEFGDYELIMEHFNYELGWEARAILRALLSDEEGDI